MESVSTDSKKPSMETYVLFAGIGFFVLYLFELKLAWTGRIERARLCLKCEVYCGALILKKPPVLFELIAAPETLMYARSRISSMFIGISCND